MSEEKTWPWYICTAVKSHFLQTKQTNPFHSPPAGATTLLDVRTMCYFFSGKCLSYSMSSKCLAELFSPARNLTEQGNQVSLKPRICDRASLSQNSRCSVCVDLLRALEVFLNQLTPIQCVPWYCQAGGEAKQTRWLRSHLPNRCSGAPDRILMGKHHRPNDPSSLCEGCITLRWQMAKTVITLLSSSDIWFSVIVTILVYLPFSFMLL